MNKEISEKIDFCNECPYCKRIATGYLCDLKGKETISISKNDGFHQISIPKWCPLDDAKDQGVKVGATALIVRYGKVLLGLRGDSCETARNEWAFPGGRMKYGEDPITCISREVKEETGMIVNENSLEFLAWSNEFFPNEKKHYVCLVFLVKNIQGIPRNPETKKCKEWKWFDPDCLPENTFKAARTSIYKYKNKIKNN